MRAAVIGLAVVSLAGCSGLSGLGNLFAPKIEEEEIIAPEVLYESALEHINSGRYRSGINDLEKLERQHPYSEYAEKSKLMTAFSYYRSGQNEEAVLAADRYLALYPSSQDVPYILYIKGSAYFDQIKDITRDQQLSADAAATFRLLINTYPDSQYAVDARDRLTIATDQLAGKEMSVGRYYQGHGQLIAAINRYKAVVTDFETSSHIEEALYRLTESYLQLGLINEARTSAAVLGHNYPSSTWYESAYTLLSSQGLTPEVVNEGLFGANLTG